LDIFQTAKKKLNIMAFPHLFMWKSGKTYIWFF